MHDLERIEHALASDDLDPTLFERCAQDLLTEVFPGLSPVPGGTDFGRDADVHGGDPSSLPPRLMVTKSRDYKGIRSNMVGGLESLKEHKIPFNHIVLANPGSLSGTNLEKLQKEAAGHGATVTDIFGRGFFASKLRRDGEWRSRLLGLSADPITLSRVPSQLAESPWAELPLVGRDDVLAEIEGAAGDVLLVGRPGVGKTRLLASVSDAMFVDAEPAEGRLADDLRWFRPAVTVIDDTARTPHLIEFVRRVRRQEADWLSMRLVVVCWPDEAEELQDLMKGATRIDLDLLERTEIDTIVRAMGIEGVVARQEILDQAEGRPGWAVALADLLLRAGWDGLLTGKSLLGQVEGYLRRSQLSVEARDLIATVAALGGVDDSDLQRLAGTVEVRRPDVGRLVRAVADGGLLDVEQYRERDGLRRHYTVRPPMLAEAIATEHFFLGEAPLGDIAVVMAKWPDRACQVFCVRSWLLVG